MRFLVLLLTLSTTFSLAQLENKLYRSGNLEALFKQIDKDEQLQFERLVAYHFHHLLNEYRTQLKLHSLYWDDRLWLAARNHNLHMDAGEFSHGESVKGEYYSGRNPINRGVYATYGDLGTSTFGENIVYNNSNEDGAADLAFHIAEQCFTDWKQSKPHNKNMLSPDYFAHGTSIISRGVVLGTTVFVGQPKTYHPNEISIDWDDELAAKYPPKFQINPLETEPSTFNERQIQSKLYYSISSALNVEGIKTDPSAMKATKSHMVYMLQNKLYETTELKSGDKYFAKDTDKRFKKSGKSKYKLSQHNLTEFILKNRYSENELMSDVFIEKYCNDVMQKINIDKGLVSWGGIVKLVKDGEEYLCITDVLLINEKPQ